MEGQLCLVESRCLETLNYELTREHSVCVLIVINWAGNARELAGSRRKGTLLFFVFLLFSPFIPLLLHPVRRPFHQRLTLN